MIGIFLTLIDTEEDKQKFILLYEEYRKLMFYVANKILNNTQLSEDAVQEAFLRIAKNFHKIGEVSCPQTKAFVVIITRNIAINFFNKEHKQLDITETVSKNVQDFSEDAFEAVSYKLLTECILKLPEKYRDILYLNHIYSYSFVEISNLLAITVETAKKRAQRARKMLKEIIEKEGF